jgi:outer membrane protein assembly factor BamB
MGSRIYQPTNRPTNQPNNQPTNQPTNEPTNQPTKVFVGEHYSIGDRLYALDALTGENLWQYREGSTYTYPLATLTDGSLLAAWGNGRIYAFPANATNPPSHPKWHGNEVAWQVNMGAGKWH